MELRSVTIHNFRAIKDAVIHLDQYSLLIGANNSGKSTVIDCLRAIYEKDKYKFSEGRDFPVMSDLDDQESWAELEFVLSPREQEDIAQKYLLPGAKIRLRKVFKTAAKEFEAGMIYGYASDGSLEKTPFYGAKGVQNGKIGEIIYVPAVSTVDEHTKLSGPSALRDLLTDLVSSVVEDSAAYAHFENHYDDFVGELRNAQNSNKQSLREFEAELDKSLEDWNAGFRIDFRTPSATDLVRSLLGWELLDQITQRQSQAGSFGSGFQRHFIFSLIRVGAKYASQSAKKKAKDFTPTLRLLLFEEPEAFLHPPQQNVLSGDLRKLTENTGWQVLCSTHSPHFVSRVSKDIRSLVRLSKANGESKVYQLDDITWQELLNARQGLANITESIAWLSEEEQQNLEILRYFLWLNPDRSGLFFADRVIVVEGVTEMCFLQRLIDDEKLLLGRKGSYVISCEGKFNLHRFLRFLTALGIRHIGIYDEDGCKGVHQQVNALIQQSATSFTIGFVVIKGCLESFLGMPEVPQAGNRIKPMLAMHRYENAEYDLAKLESFCRNVEALV